jgi:hypothetical protein
MASMRDRISPRVMWEKALIFDFRFSIFDQGISGARFLREFRHQKRPRKNKAPPPHARR